MKTKYFWFVPLFGALAALFGKVTIPVGAFMGALIALLLTRQDEVNDLEKQLNSSKGELEMVKCELSISKSDGEYYKESEERTNNHFTSLVSEVKELKGEIERYKESEETSEFHFDAKCKSYEGKIDELVNERDLIQEKLERANKELEGVYERW